MNILIIEDNSDHLELVEEGLNAVYDEVHIQHKASLADGLALLKQNNFDLLLCDLNLIDSSTEMTTNRLAHLETEVPIVVLTLFSNNDQAKKLIQSGIQDYLPKLDLKPESLARTCNFAIERKKFERQLEERNKNLNAFCQMLSHDFRSHIRHILQFTELMEADGLDGNDILNRIKTSAERMKSLSQDLYDYLAMDLPQKEKEPIDLNQITKDVEFDLRDIIQKKSAQINKNTLPSILGTHGQMTLLIQNLLSNSLKFSNKPIIEIKAIHLENKTGFVVKDNGAGIQNDRLKSIFEPFVQYSSQEGSGLGLAIVKRVVQKSNGNLTVKSEPGKGTAIEIVWPKSKAQPG